MQKWMSVLLVLAVVVGCKTFQPLNFDPRVTAPPVNLPPCSSHQSGIYFVLMPPAFSNALNAYTSQFILDSATYLESKSVRNQHDFAQQLFFNTANDLGGLFDGSDGTLNTRVLNDAIRLTAAAIFDQDETAQSIVFISPYTEYIERINGLARWAGTEQKSSMFPGTTRSTGMALSLRLNYVMRDGKPQYHNIGLDAEDERFISVNKYRFIAEHVFSPMFDAAPESQ